MGGNTYTRQGAYSIHIASFFSVASQHMLYAERVNRVTSNKNTYANLLMSSKQQGVYMYATLLASECILVSEW
jgi:hypothetical protein